MKKKISHALGTSCNILNIEVPKNATHCIRNIEQCIKNILSKMPDNGKGYVLDPIIKPSDVTPTQYQILEQINENYSSHYTLRNEIIKKRFQVTIESMLESDKAKESLQEIEHGLEERLASMDTDKIHLPASSIFIATPDLFRIDKLTRITSDLESDVRKVTIGNVPDRGGRPDEIRQMEIENIPFGSFGDHRRNPRSNRSNYYQRRGNFSRGYNRGGW